jgi:hypothetical protein
MAKTPKKKVHRKTRRLVKQMAHEIKGVTATMTVVDDAVQYLINLEGPPVTTHHTMLMLAGAIYLIETQQAEITGFDISTNTGAPLVYTHMPYEFRIAVRSNSMPAIADVASSVEQEAFCERVSQWFGQRAIDIRNERESRKTVTE